MIKGAGVGTVGETLVRLHQNASSVSGLETILDRI